MWFRPRFRCLVNLLCNEPGERLRSFFAKIGGTTIVQEPEEAQNPEMPIAALEARAVHFCLPIIEIAAKLTELSD